MDASTSTVPGRPLSSFDEWSPLEEVILGSARNYVAHERERSFELFFHSNLFTGWYYPRIVPRQSAITARGITQWPIKQRFVEQYLSQKMFEVYRMNDAPLDAVTNTELCKRLERIVGLEGQAQLKHLQIPAAVTTTG